MKDKLPEILSELIPTPDMQRIDSVRVIGDAFAISKVDSLNLKDEFNQVKGKIMTIYFQEGQLKEARVKGMPRLLHMPIIRMKKNQEGRPYRYSIFYLWRNYY